MKLNEMLKVKTKSKKRIGRGLGSGKGKTGGRGTKGQKARGKIPAAFSGDLAFFKKLPLRRGQGNAKVSVKPKLVNLSKLEVFKAKTVVDLAKLLEAKVITEKDVKKGVKILGEGEIKSALIIKLPVSASARQKIESVGGKIEHV